MVKNSARTTGILYVVATPIGNLNDISFRAIETLKSVDVILAEDTRHSAPFLQALGIHKPLDSLHSHNEAQKSQQHIESLLNGRSLALISDAGTPLINDPGFPLVRLAQKNQIQVIPIPGACAFVTALSAAGVSCDSFSFIGFLPAKETARRAKLKALQQSKQTIVFYESTHRIRECLEDLIFIYGADYELVVAKELTKAYEKFIRGTSQSIKEWFLEDEAHYKGEFVFILPAQPLVDLSKQREKEILSLLISELPLKQAVKLTSLITKTNKNEIYKLALGLKEES